MKRLPWCGVFILVAALAPAARQSPTARPGIATPQPAPSPTDPAARPIGTGRIRGRIVGADTGAPLRGAQVTLSGATFRRATADDEGRYEFMDLPGGRYSLQASHGAYLSLSYGQRRALEPGRPIALADGQALNQIDIALPRGSVIAGRITDELGEPVPAAQIRIERYQHGPGGPQLVTFPLGLALGGFITTNDLGEFRVFGLMPGEYIVSARMQSREVTAGTGVTADAAETFRPTHYPGTVSVTDATPVTVGMAQEITADFALAPGRMARISGMVVNSSGRPAAGMSVRLVTETATSSGAANGGTVAADGSFSIGNVAPGEYVLRVQSQPAEPGAEVASLPIVVSTADLRGIVMTTRPGTTIRGRLEWEGRAPRPTTTLRVNTTSALFPRRGPTGEFTITYLDLENGTVLEDDTFELGGIIGPVLFRILVLPPPWTVKAVMADGKDITDTGADAATLGGDTRVRLVLTDRLTRISGSARDAGGQPLLDYAVVLLPEQEMEGGTGLRFTRTVRPDQTGSFSVDAMPPGRYVAAAVDGLEQGREWDPEFQRTVRTGGESFTLVEGQSLTLNLVLLP
jgi:hypothetical protein